MKKNIKGIKDKLIDAFLITRVKVGSFIKEHKMTSAFIGLFIFSGVIALIVYASEENYKSWFKIDGLVYDAKDITSSDQLSYDEINKNYEVQSFSTLSYSTNYILKLKDPDNATKIDGNITRTVVIVATAECTNEIVCSQLSWSLGDESVTSTLDNNDSMKRKVTFKKSNVGLNTTTTQNIYLNVGNIANGSTYSVTVEAYEDTNDANAEDSAIATITKSYVVSSKKTTLSTELVGGIPYKVENNIKYVPFGILLKVNGKSDLKGLYIDPTQKINLKASQAYIKAGGTTSDSALIELLKTSVTSQNEIKYYGIYDKEMSYLKNMPIIASDGTSVELIEPEPESTEKNYTFKINNIGFDNVIEKNNSLIIGSYYVTAKSSRTSENTDPINVTLTEGESNSKTVINKYNSVGTKEIKLEAYKTDTEGAEQKLATNEFVAYGESLILSSKFSYSADADADISKLTITIPLNNMKLINYDSESDSLPYSSKVYNLDGTETNLEGTVKLCKGTTCKDFSSITDYSGIDNVKYEMENVKPGSTVDFRIKALVGTSGSKITLSDCIAEFDGSSKKALSIEINLTPFKVSSKVLIDGTNDDVLVNSNDTSKNQITIYPSIYFPAQAINSTATGIGSFKEFVLTIKLPKYVKLVENDEYVKYTSYKNGTLIYKIENVLPNDWIEPVMFDISYDVKTPTNTELDITVVSQATANALDGSSPPFRDDESGEESRTTTRTITYINNNSIAYNQYSSKGSISKNGNFEITTELKNNTGSEVSDIKLLTILPYNDVSTNSFTGSYEISSIPTNTKCTKEKIISKNHLLSSATNWEACPTKISSTSGITAILTDNILLPVYRSDNDYYTQQFKITTSNNSTDNMYKFDSYFANSNDEIISIPSTKVTVISKKITGTVWEDFDADGIFDNEESRVSDINLSLYNDKDELVSQTTPNEKGIYTFNDLSAGSYYIVADFNNAKYGLTNYRATNDLSVTSSFNSENVEEETSEVKAIIKTELIQIEESTKSVNNINLGLTLKKVYKIKLSKYITSVEVANGIGIVTKNDFKNATLAKVNIKNMSGFSIKALYTIELENIGYYPGFVLRVKDYIPAGMSFNPNYEENDGWNLTTDGILENTSLRDELIYGGEKKYLTLALDVSRKEAGSFINTAEIEDDDLQILNVSKAEEGDINE